MNFQEAQNKAFPAKRHIQVKGQLYDFSNAMIMGIINLTPDSFHSSSRAAHIDAALLQAAKHIEEGAAILDLGAYSSRPGAEDINTETELRRLLPTLKAIRKEFPNTLVSVDTFRSEVADKALNEGADLINDISGGVLDDAMFDVIAKHKAPYIMMHMQGTPQNMQENPHYEDIVNELIQYFSVRLKIARDKGINDIIFDPGIGFGKSLKHNYLLLKSVERFKLFGLPILIGISRKSVVNKVLGTKPEDALNGSTVLHSILAQKMPMIYRVHDVKEMHEVIQITDFYQNIG